MKRFLVACTAAAVMLTVGIAGAARSAPTGARDRLHLYGDLTVDGEPLNSRFLGAVVVRGDLVSPCQFTIPTVVDGKYDIYVFGRKETAGCGARGAQIALWTYVSETQLYTNDTFEWPGNGKTTRFDATFSAATPNGAVPELTIFSGEVYDRDGGELPGGTRIEAYVGDTRCGVGSVRRTGEFTGYVLAVVGPDSVPECALGATIEFLIDGRPAIATAINGEQVDDDLDLALR
jgi:hypothetical protein